MMFDWKTTSSDHFTLNGTHPTCESAGNKTVWAINDKRSRTGGSEGSVKPPRMIWKSTQNTCRCFVFSQKLKIMKKKERKESVCVRGTDGDISRMSFSENKSCVCQKRE